jgi:hypothetical protein
MEEDTEASDSQAEQTQKSSKVRWSCVECFVLWANLA